MGLLGQSPAALLIRAHGQLIHVVNRHSHGVHETLPLLLVRLLVVPCLPGLLLVLNCGLLHRLQGRWGHCTLRLHCCRARGSQRAAGLMLQAAKLICKAYYKQASAPR